MTFSADPNYYPRSFHGGHKFISSETSGDNTLELHEFYNEQGKVVFKWKILKNSDGDTIEWKLKLYAKGQEADPASTYVSFDDLT